MKKNQLIALIIAIITVLGPFNFAYMNSDISQMGLKVVMMVLTMAGSIAAVAIGSSKVEEH